MQEYQNDKSNLLITDTNPKQSVYVFKCVKSTLTVSGKVNSIILGESLLLEKQVPHPLYSALVM